MILRLECGKSIIKEFNTNKRPTHLQNIDTQIGQIFTSLSNLESQLFGKLPSQPHPNPKEQAHRVMIRNSE
ncbi:putative mRNA-capping enzyme [Bienertia sinuspersici]